MAFEIVWTTKAASSFEKIVLYLEENWTEKEIRRFVGKTDRLLNVIQEFPLSFLNRLINKFANCNWQAKHFILPG